MVLCTHPVTPLKYARATREETTDHPLTIPIQDVARHSRALAVIATTRAAFKLDHTLPFASDVYFTSELLSTILIHCDHSTVMAVSRLNRYGRRSAQEEIRQRIRRVLDPFVTANEYVSFMEMLQTTGSIIIGSVARRLFTMKAMYIEDLRGSYIPRWSIVARLIDCTGHTRDIYTSCANLNIVTQASQGATCRQWFSQRSYRSWTPFDEREPNTGFVRVANSFATAHKIVRPDKVSDCHSQPVAYTNDFNVQCGEVTVTESRKGVMSVVVTSTFTAQMNAISASTLYCLYPNLATSIRSLRCTLTGKHLGLGGVVPFEYEDDNSEWNEPCGPFCPAVPRKTVGDRGVATFRWNPEISVPGSRDPETDYLLAEQTLKWKYSKYCRNRRCVNYTPLSFYACVN
jgi:hypothetical protein